MSRWRVFGLCMDIEGFLRQNRFPHGYDIFQQDDGTRSPGVRRSPS